MSTQWCLSGCLPGCFIQKFVLCRGGKRGRREDREGIPEDAINLDEVLEATMNNASTFAQIRRRIAAFNQERGCRR
jgi:hypothetical protein